MRMLRIIYVTFIGYSKLYCYQFYLVSSFPVNDDYPLINTAFQLSDVNGLQNN